LFIRRLVSGAQCGPSGAFLVNHVNSMPHRIIARAGFLGIVFFLLSGSMPAQKVADEEIRSMVDRYKTDIRGPFKEIRWYCPDGSIIPPNERCPEPGGVQRARHKDEVTALAGSNHIFLGQILATTPYADFWDEGMYNSRLKQYQLEKYLRASDNGWVLRRAQFYRGAYQAEDEEQWGINFFNWLLSDKRILEEQFFLVREAARDIPHGADDNLKQNIRLGSREIADAYAPFLDIRVKLHGQPGASDVEKVKQFREDHKNRMPKEPLARMDQLIKDLEKQYEPFDIASVDPFLKTLSKESAMRESLLRFQSAYRESPGPSGRIPLLSLYLLEIRHSVLQAGEPDVRLALLDISIVLEDLLFKELAQYQPATLYEQIGTITDLGRAAAGCGYLELWEWEQLKGRMDIEGKPELTDKELYGIFEACRSITEWGTGMFMAVYEDVADLYSGFEPLSNGFLDEKIRASLLLQIGSEISSLRVNLAAFLPLSGSIMDLANTSGARGLNPGIAAGELVVVPGKTDDIVFDKNKIYVFNKPPSDMKPVAGILTVTEGNPVSHIQLLARNLGIPNAVITLQNLEELKANDGQRVFYAVSSEGVVVMKPEASITPQERALFETKAREETKIAVPVNKIDLKYTSILLLTDVDARSSGKVCGPKAANLGQLKKLFPEHVVDGLVIPFGIFREHLDQPMPGTGTTYWDYLNLIFDRAAEMNREGKDEAEVDGYVMNELRLFQSAIRQISLSDSFIEELQLKFIQVFHKESGAIPVFLRSDTNMEDLKDFTGAGLNLTLFNVVDRDVILQGIRDVWASPYSERSYRWRQRFLLNPENVFPSILIIPSVDVDYSGVAVTKGVGQGSLDDVTVAFNRGAGGAVDGQAAESYLLKQDGTNILLTPAREPQFRSLPVSGGTSTSYTWFDQPILNEINLEDLRKITSEIRVKLPKSPGIGTRGPFDMELGFKNNELWLFQVRPFVENTNAAESIYLERLNPEPGSGKMVPLNQTLTP
jgi:hypothetical protein